MSATGNTGGPTSGDLAGTARPSFGARLRRAMADRGPLCVGIDPHPGLLTAWGLPDDAGGLERFALGAVEALGDLVAVLKPQAAFFERHGAAGIGVLERVLRACADAGALSIVDAKRGDIGSTMAAYADAYAGDDSPLAGDSVTASPYLGFGSLRPLLDAAAASGRGVFVLALTSNPEGATVQQASGPDGRTVAQAVVDAAAAENAGTDDLGSVGVVVGITAGAGPDPGRPGWPEPGGSGLGGLDLSLLAGPVLAPGVGAQGGSAADLRQVFGPAARDVLPSTSREVLAAGPSRAALRAAARRTLDQVLTAVAG